MGQWRPVSNLRDQVSRHPPVVVFFLSLLILSITFVGIGLYSRNHDIKNPDISVDWNGVLGSIAGFKFCTHLNDTDAPLEEDSPRMVEHADRTNISMSTAHVSLLVPLVFIGDVPDDTVISATMLGSQLGMKGAAAKASVNISLLLHTDVPNNQTPAGTKTRQPLTCLHFTALTHVLWTPYLDIQNDLGQTALHLAVIVDRSECVRALLWSGASAEIQERGGNTPLHLAVRELRTECVRELTSCSRTPPEHLSITNYAGVSALHLAVYRGNCDIIKMLLEAGADANQRDLGSGRSPLHWAVEGQRSAVVELLLSAGALVNQRSYAGHTPYYCALYRPNKEVQALLSAHGATYTQDDEEEEEYRESDEEEFDDVIINGQRVL